MEPRRAYCNASLILMASSSSSTPRILRKSLRVGSWLEVARTPIRVRLDRSPHSGSKCRKTPTATLLPRSPLERECMASRTEGKLTGLDAGPGSLRCGRRRRRRLRGNPRIREEPRRYRVIISRCIRFGDMNYIPTSTAPAVNPAPAAVNNSFSPDAKCLWRFASESESGIVAAEELPWSSMLRTILDGSMPRLPQTASDIRTFA